MFADVVISQNAYELNRTFSYAVPMRLLSEAVPGKRVLVPFGKYKKTEGILIRLYEDAPIINKIKEIIEILDSEPMITKSGFQIAEFVQNRYLAGYYDSLRLNMPSGLKNLLEERFYLIGDPKEEEGTSGKILEALRKYPGAKEQELLELLNKKGIKKELSALRDRGKIEAKLSAKPVLTDKTAHLITLITPKNQVLSYIQEHKKNRAQHRVLNLLINNKSMLRSDLLLLTNTTTKTLEPLFNAGLIETEEIPLLRTPYPDREEAIEQKKTPTEEQTQVIGSLLTACQEEHPGTFLLRGVTGSGKTEVYLQVIEEVMKTGKNAIVLVPEISLTPQMVDRFFRRFAKGVAVIHSGLSQAERYDQFKRIRNQEIRVVIGARSAVFAPLENLGILIVDEEHEQSYKSDSHPQYDAVEVAAFRAKLDGALLVLSSATPSISSYFRAQRGTYSLLTMENRFNQKALPLVEVVDMKKELEEGNFSPISRALAIEIEKNIQAGEQTILFLNRRGFSTFVSCRGCGFVARCPHCAVSLTYHQSSSKLLCHYCGYERPHFQECPSCKSKYIKHFGSGTQKIEAALQEQFPGISVIRMDADTTYKKFSHEKILKSFEKENINVLLGTQMVTKGLDFQNVTLSAVLAADGGLFLEDYRSPERTFSQITQVCGRSGRGEKPGRGIVQTYHPDHYVISFAREHDYENFYKTEINFRKQMNFPPFCDIINIICISASSNEGQECIGFLYRILLSHKKNLGLSEEQLKLYPPGPAPLAKIKNKYRFRLLMKAKNGTALTFVLEDLIKEFHKKYKGQKPGLSVEINPVSLL